MEHDASQHRSRLKAMFEDSRSQILSEVWLKSAWDVIRRRAHYHLVEHPLIGEMGQSVILIFLALFLLSSAAGILNTRYWATRETLAHEEFERARGLNEQGQHEEALRRLRAAFHLEHHNREYQMALTTTLIQLGRYDEARLQLNDMLRDDPTNATANLMLARIAAARGEESVDEAVQFYQRAIYGLWPSNPTENRVSTRFELAELLAAQNRLEALRAELISLAADIRDNVDELRRVGWLMLFAQSPDTASEVFGRVLAQKPRDADALAGQGKAELELGNFAAAELALLRAARFNPQNKAIQEQLAVVQDIRGMNPLRRGLGIYTKANRSVALLAKTYQPLFACSENTVLPQEVQEDLSAAKERLETRRRGVPTDEMVEGNIALALQLHRDASDYCSGLPENEALNHLVASLSREQ